MKDAQKHVVAILSRIRKEGCILMLDFDGTLAPVVSDPRRARMGARTRHALEIIARRYPVAVITGRALSDVQTRVPIRRISFAGNHGFESRIAGKRYFTRVPAPIVRARDKAGRRLASLQEKYKGLYFEDKKFTLFVHYRHVAAAEVASARRDIFRAVRDAGKGRLLRANEAIQGVSILPAVRCNKGTAAWEMYASLAGRKKPVPVFIGDDVTDEDAFRALKRGITIRVGKSSGSAARYYFKSRSGVDGFLKAMAGK
jgi:trehalose-phosphatase